MLNLNRNLITNTVAFNPVRPTSPRRLRLSVFALVLFCCLFWFAKSPSSSSSSSQPTQKETSQARGSHSRGAAAHNWKLGHNNGNSRKMEAALQAPVPAQPGSASMTSSRIKKDLVVASMVGDNTTWLYDSLPDWHKSIYVVDDKTADLTVAKNKGRESMVYLTYIIDNYDHLPDYVLFIHSERYQWHNDDPYYDGVPMIRRLQIPYLELIGYVNLRCAWVLGCPDEIHPMTDDDFGAVHAGPYYLNGFKELFPGSKVPETIAVSCCAQFGVARWKIRERPKSDYERYKKWLLQTSLDDAMSGRIMEYSWHIIFGMNPIHCPNAAECYCNVWGLCDLKCSQDECEDRYELPPYSTLPEGWPQIGWNGQPQDPGKGGLPLVD